MGASYSCLGMCVSENDISAELVLGCKTIIGKNLVWDDVENRLMWLDIEGKKIWEFDYHHKTSRSIQLEERPGALVLTKGKEVIVALEKRLAKLNLQTEQLETISHFDRNTSMPHSRPNDGGCDRAGRFLLLGLNEVGQVNNKGQTTPDTTGLYSLGGLKSNGKQGDRKMESILPSLPCIDGICFNQSGTVMYLCNVTRREILQFDYNQENGTLKNQRQFYKMEKGMPGFPSGAAVDAEGLLWSCHCGGGKVVRHSPTGSIISVVELPVESPTAVAFGGPNLDELFIITSRIEERIDDAQNYSPSAGGLFVAQVSGVRGLVEPKFTGEFENMDQCLIS